MRDCRDFSMCNRKASAEHAHLKFGQALEQVTDGALHGDREAGVKLADHIVAALAIMGHDCAQAAQDNGVLLIQHSLEQQQTTSPSRDNLTSLTVVLCQ